MDIPKMNLLFIIVVILQICVNVNSQPRWDPYLGTSPAPAPDSPQSSTGGSSLPPWGTCNCGLNETCVIERYGNGPLQLGCIDRYPHVYSTGRMATGVRARMVGSVSGTEPESNTGIQGRVSNIMEDEYGIHYLFYTPGVSTGLRVNITKTGFCSRMPPTRSFQACVPSCSSDTECSGTRKCCPNGCSIGCVTPNQAQPRGRGNGSGDLPRVCQPLTYSIAIRCLLVMPRWTYNRDSGRCEYFIYGGCGGSANKFVSEEWCLRKCRTRVSRVTAAPVSVAPVTVTTVTSTNGGVCQPLTYSIAIRCLLVMPRWTYNRDSGRCEYFIYGGCGGSANKFVSEESCLRKCRTRVSRVTAAPVSVAPVTVTTVTSTNGAKPKAKAKAVAVVKVDVWKVTIKSSNKDLVWDIKEKDGDLAGQVINYIKRTLFQTNGHSGTHTHGHQNAPLTHWAKVAGYKGMKIAHYQNGRHLYHKHFEPCYLPNFERFALKLYKAPTRESREAKIVTDIKSIIEECLKQMTYMKQPV